MLGNNRIVVAVLCCSPTFSFHPVPNVPCQRGSYPQICKDQRRAILLSNSADKLRTMKFPCYNSRLALNGVQGGDDSRQISSSVVPSYHLVWSAGVWKRIVLSFCVFSLVRSVFPPSQILFDQSHHLFKCSHGRNTGFMSNLFHLFVVPMMSSACCSIQILVNALAGAGGCAGFNTYLGPLRPFFIGFLLFTTLISAITSLHSRSVTLPWITYTAATWVMGFLPEIVQIWNTRATRQWQKRHEAQSAGGAAMKATVELDIPSMGCVACINKIDSSLRQCAPEKIEEAKSWLEKSETGKGGKARIELALSADDDIATLADIVVNAVRAAGFGSCTLKSINSV